MSNKTRQQAILELIAENELDTQEELAAMLHKCGYNVTQATVSRDIKQLGLVKIAGKEKKYRYTQVSYKERGLHAKYDSIFKESVLNIRNAGNLIVIKTVTGAANSACAHIDRLNIEQILGSIAGDDTIFCVTKSEQDAIEVINLIKESY
ncbi:MAG: arginine repressor [Clostridia bacterium]|jgi:transcriptional regulator of arginine metabolism|nr:arginine repressor [Clostridia bacterium]MCI9290176.1 arginine repressor [Clostridia bacterium]